MNNKLLSISNKTKKFSSLLKSYVELEYLLKIKKISKPKIGKWVTEKLTNMGPTFIKIGQLMSTRKDILGEEIINELKQLQDNVSPLPYNTLEEYITDFSNDFESIDTNPIASASIGQVHTGILKNGNKIVIKIKRPNIEKLINEDFEMLLFSINILKKISNDRKIYEFELLFNEYYKLLKEEINFENEANNMIKFKENFKNIKWIKIPYLYKNLCSNNIITMEYVPSIKINDINTISKLQFNRKKIAEKLIEIFMIQIIDHGTVHIDPHPGNIGINKDGKIVFYDFGMILDIDLNIKEKFTTLLIAIYDKDINTICDISIDMGLIIVEEKNKPYLKTFFISFLKYIENSNIEEFKETYIDKFNSLTNPNEPNPFIISSKFILLLRGISILEGVCKTLYPKFNFKDSLDPYINTFILDINYFESRAISDLKLITKVPEKVQINQINLEVIEKNIQDVEKKIQKEQTEKHFILIALIISLFMYHEFNQGLLTATIFFIYYFSNISVK